MRGAPNQGFSLLELLLVLIILGIVAMVAVPGLPSGDLKRLELAAGEIAGAIRYARSEAIRTGEPKGFQLQSTKPRIRVISLDTSSNPWAPIYDVEHPGVHNYYDIELASNPYTRVDGITRNASFHGTCNNPDLIYFDASGIPSCGDSGSAVVDQYEMTLSYGSQARVISLHGITGRVTVQ